MWFIRVSDAAVLYYGGLRLTLIAQEMFDMLLEGSKWAAKWLNFDANGYFSCFLTWFLIQTNTYCIFIHSKILTVFISYYDSYKT